MTTDDDPISAASAGLRALGVAPQRRVETLGLLSALIDLADERGFVELDNSLMETEERLGIDSCLEGYDWLENLDVIRRTYSGWVIQHFEAHRGPAGMTEESMAVLQRHLASTEDAPVLAPVATPEAAPQPAAVPDAGAPVVTLKSWRRRVPVVAASVAAGVAMLAGATQLVPQAAVTTRNAAARGATTTIRVAATSPAAAPTVPSGAATTVTNAIGAAVGAAPEATTTTTSTTLVPTLPCLGDVLRGLGDKTGLRTTPTTQAAPGVLPCP